VKIPSSMRMQCRVLLELADSSVPMKPSELAARTGLTEEQVSGAMRPLLIKQKVRRVLDTKGKNTTVGADTLYEYSESEPLPNVIGHRGVVARSTKRQVARSALLVVSNIPRANQPEQPKLLRVKLRLLERLLDILKGDDRDVLLGIIADYHVLLRRKVA